MLIEATIKINNMPLGLIKDQHGYLVARRGDDASLWYYGLYDTYNRALDVAVEIKNGIVVKI